MALRIGGRKLSFEVLRRSEDDSLDNRSNSDPTQSNRKKRKHRASRRKKKHLDLEDSIADSGDPNSKRDAPLENGRACNGFELDARMCCAAVGGSVVCEEVREASVCTVAEARDAETELSTSALGAGEGFNFGELRQRNVNGCSSEDLAASVVGDDVGTGKDDGGVEKPTNEPDRNVVTKLEKLETVESLDWKRLMAEDPNYIFSVDKSPVAYFLEEMYNGNSLRSTTTLGNEKERERVYDTIFRLPWRCELLIDVGFFVCFDSFLSLLTIMPTRIMMTVWRLLKTRQFKRLSTIELSDFGCFVIMSCGVILLQRTDISLIYHMIRGQGTIKLYVVYNVLEIFDKLCQSFNGDVLQTLFHTAEGLANCPPESMRFWIWRFFSDQALAVAASIAHSFILLAQAITLSTCIVAHNNALLALLVSNNFAEIKSNVFKRYSKDNVHSLVYFDSVERFHISAFILFVLAQNILEAEGPWFKSFLINILLVYVCEMVIDIIKHSFIAKFNDIKPIAYSEFLEDLCKQTLNMQTEGSKKNLTFVPLAPACVVIRVLTPVYSANLPPNPLPWRLFWILLFSATIYVMLTSLKVLIGMGLQKHASWYIKRCRRRKHHLHAD
ncbi:protein POLLEN DEFECTIVE IN GUIDANCE 1 [Gastrolobium bilobum]|uniref:protein POLLEN DEFECTIVE IN GUIDANCE 1 n=1 Tax=Gastrolobium bilobum TaxID=150636 RepID=UPI002AB0EAE7|nr:protein POLLEN DEFECTIVE IN GUIDANCE 1 [Gastrolobium bilobum]